LASHEKWCPSALLEAKKWEAELTNLAKLYCQSFFFYAIGGVLNQLELKLSKRKKKARVVA
jgi:hypothetical protein